MLIVGERLNTSRAAAAAMVGARDAEAVRREAARQVEAGATYIDANAGTFAADEPEVLRWLVTTVLEAVPAPLCLDSPSPAALRGALEAYRTGAAAAGASAAGLPAEPRPKPLVNSITGEKARFSAILPLVREFGAAVVALCLDDTGMPSTADEVVSKGSRLVEDLLGAGVAPGDIYLDPLARSVGADFGAGAAAVEAIRRLRSTYPEVHAICGLSNVSFGLPRRSLLNRAFLVAAMAAGLDAVICDPLDGPLMATLVAAEAVLGRDRHCSRYLKAYRQGRLEKG